MDEEAVLGDGSLLITTASRIRKVAPNGTISTFAGGGNSIDNFGDGGPATDATLLTPYDIDVDGSGNVYVADEGHDLIRRIDRSGIITTVAGDIDADELARDPVNIRESGPARSIHLHSPQGVVLDGGGNLFISDTINNRVRKVDVNGQLTTVAGRGRWGFAAEENSGDLGAALGAKVKMPWGLVIDLEGNLYIGATNSIRMIPGIAVPRCNDDLPGPDVGAGLAGDFDSDGAVGFSDFLLFAANFGKENFDLPFDLDNSGKVDFADFLIFASNFGSGANKPVKPAVLRSRGEELPRLSFSVLSGGQENEVSVNVTGLKLPAIKGFSGLLRFDSEATELLGVTIEGASSISEASKDDIAIQTSHVPGEVWLADILDSPADPTDLMALRFRVRDSRLEQTITMGQVEIVDALGAVHPVMGGRLLGWLPVPSDYALNQNYPNPFNPMTNISYQTPEAGNVSLVVYNLLGQEIRKLVNGHHSAGYHSVFWDGRDELGRGVASGVYLYRLNSGEFSGLRRLVVLQ